MLLVPYEEQRITAYHESSHVVPRVVCGLEIYYTRIYRSYVWIERTRMCGQMVYRPARRRSRYEAGVEAISLLASIEAEHLASRNKKESHLDLALTGCSLDVRQATVLCDRHEFDIRKVREGAAAIVRRNWAAIEAVANALLNRPKLTHNQVLNVMPRWPLTAYDYADNIRIVNEACELVG